MAGTFSQINIHAVFAVKYRESIIAPEWRKRLFSYMNGILRAETDFALAVDGWYDHVHLFFEQKTSQSTADILRIVKANSSKWINEQHFLPGKFNWQEGYGAFSYSRSQRDDVIKYIMSQEQHHKKVTFREEYLNMLEAFGIPHDPKYLFDFFE